MFIRNMAEKLILNLKLMIKLLVNIYLPIINIGWHFMICFISSRQITMSWHIGCTVISQINGICGPVEKMEFKLNLKYRSFSQTPRQYKVAWKYKPDS